MSLDDYRGNVLSKDDLLGRLQTPEVSKKLYIVPMVDTKLQVGQGSIDLRLGTDFVVMKRTNYSIMDPLDGRGNIQTRIAEYYDRIYVNVGKRLVLHPNQIVLGCTLEYFRLPPDLIAYVIGRSSWGRLGLIIATATLVHPGYTGIVTLELVNVGDTPIALYPGVRIAQIVFHKITPSKIKPEDYITKITYGLSTRPSFSKIYQDREWKILSQIKEKLS